MPSAEYFYKIEEHMFAFRKYAVYNVHVPGKKEHDRVSKISENGGMVIMEFTYMGYRIERPANSEKVVVYRDNCRLFNLIVSHPETDDELLHEAKEVARILDV